ncbi:peptide ABC transporter ATPase [Thermosipho africanus Ob7]|jgi:peptide/nickel transport system ATP-binding protein|uniref:ABC transporter ATP-binding protein n=1 Tax=Thermosipho africanus TaxID=2421 RepID=UPI000E0B6F5B|nr:ABC transporter ATP-binding protein [Thermosipho africanus]MDK2839423.1 peptide/nickel transport system ATP-binding protein [Thermosipho sp. (in: thermotogales)]RDI90623.1 peptide ABC transporter ATPase [Thermosipho africanus Ob7]
MLAVNGLKLYYKTLKGYVKAVDDVSFDLKDNEILGLAGESGCGKSTLVNGLILLKPPLNYFGGNVILDNELLPINDFEKMNDFRYKRLSIIPQYAMDALNPTRKIGVYIKEVLKSKGINYDSIHDRLIERLKFVNLPERVLKMYPIELSGGMKQRLVMVISTLLNPSLLIADEVTSALDVSSQKSVCLMIKGFKDEGIVKSLIFVTHDLSVLYQIADRIMVMYAGKVAEIGTTQQIIENPVHPYTKMLLSSLPEVGIRYTDTRLKGIPGRPPQLLNPPKGCRFKDRCPFYSSQCDNEPPKVQVEDNHIAYCWKVNKND